MRSKLILAAALCAITGTVVHATPARQQPLQRYIGHSFCVVAPNLSGKLVSDYRADWLGHRIRIGRAEIFVYEGNGNEQITKGPVLTGNDGWLWRTESDGKDVIIQHLTGQDFPAEIQIEGATHAHLTPQQVIGYFRDASQRICK